MTEPVSLSLAKAQCRVVSAGEDALITSYITAAREFVEDRTGHLLLQRSVIEQHPYFSRYLELRRRPVVSVESIGYADGSGSAAAYTGFALRNVGSVARIYPAANGVWPLVGLNGEVTVTYTAGYSTGAEPRALIQAMLLLIGTWYENRETIAVDVRGVPTELPMAVAALCDQFRAGI